MFKFLSKLKLVQTDDVLRNKFYITYFSKIDKAESEKILKRVFNTAEGEKALAYLQFITLQKAHSYLATKEQLYFIEGQRALITNILRITSTK